MRPSDLAKVELRRAEGVLRQLAAQAAAAGEYADTTEVVQLAEKLGQMARNGEAGRTDSSKVQPAHARAPAGKSSASGSQHATRSNDKAKSKPTTSEYPKFAIRDNEIIRIGWSKTDKATYEHRATRKRVECVCDAILRLAKTSNLVSTDELLPVIDPLNGTEVPAYQVYVCLGWLKNKHAIKAVGRQGYDVVNDGQIVREALKHWDTK